MEQYDLKNSPRDRLCYVMDVFGFRTDYALATATGISRSTIRSALDRDAIGPTTAVRIADKLNLSVAWLQHGIGDPPDAIGDELGSRSDVWSRDSETARDTNGPRKYQETGLQEADPGLPAVEYAREFVLIQKSLVKLSAGGGLIPVPDETFAEEKYAFRLDWMRRVGANPRNVLLMEVEGDSMSPTLQNHNLVLVDLGRSQLRSGQIFAIGIGEAVTVKRLDFAASDRVAVLSDNPLYRTFEMPIDEIRIIGRVIWSARTWV